jgi:hypothetical protein
VNVATATNLTTALGNATVNNTITWFQFGGNTYIVDGDGTSGYNASGDLVIKITGLVDLHAATLSGNTLTIA